MTGSRALIMKRRQRHKMPIDSPITILQTILRTDPLISQKEEGHQCCEHKH